MNRLGSSVMPSTGRPRSTLFWVLVTSVGVHLVGGVVVGSLTIYRYTRPPEATFSSPPPAVQLPPEAIEYRVQMQQLQQQSLRPVQESAARADAFLQQDLQALTTDLSSALAPALSGTPVIAGGGGLAGARLSSSIGFGVSAVDFFGVKKSGERVALIVDAGASMVAPERGDLPGYERVKAELATLVERLSPGTLFNIIVFERAVDVFAPELVAATADNKQRVPDWVAPYWRLDGRKIEQRGTFRKNYQPVMTDWPDDGGASRLDLALIAAFEMQADLIFVLTDGTPSVQKGRNAAADEQWRAAQVRHREARAAYEASAKGRREMEAYERKRAEWQARRDAVNADRRRRGLPPVVREGHTGAPKRPGPGEPREPTTYYSTEELIRYARNRARELYRASRIELPSVNVVGYSADPRAEEFIAALARAFPDSTARNIGRFDAGTRH